MAVVRPWSEEALADQLREKGRTVRLAHGRFWQALKPGFYGPMHWLARLTPDQARRPGPCWGFLARLDDDFVDQANASIPVHVIPDLDAYGFESLPRNATFPSPPRRPRYTYRPRHRRTRLSRPGL